MHGVGSARTVEQLELVREIDARAVTIVCDRTLGSHPRVRHSATVNPVGSGLPRQSDLVSRNLHAGVGDNYPDGCGRLIGQAVELDPRDLVQSADEVQFSLGNHATDQSRIRRGTVKNRIAHFLPCEVRFDSP